MISTSSNFGELPKLYIDVEKQMRFAVSVALNKTAFLVQEAIKSDISTRFDRPTPYTQNALRVRKAKRDDLAAHVDFKDGGAAGKGTSADQYLAPQVYGGSRSMKRSERALARAGMSAGQYMVPGAGADLDGYGNVSRGQIVKVLSYLQAFGESGYRANSTARSRARLAQMSGPNMKGKKKSDYAKINGVVYFTSRGKGTTTNNRRQPLPAGVWRKTGTHGADVKPVFLFVDDPQYTPILPFYETADEVFGQSFESEYETALDAAMRTAR